MTNLFTKELPGWVSYYVLGLVTMFFALRIPQVAIGYLGIPLTDFQFWLFLIGICLLVGCWTWFIVRDGED